LDPRFVARDHEASTLDARLAGAEVASDPARPAVRRIAGDDDLAAVVGITVAVGSAVCASGRAEAFDTRRDLVGLDRTGRPARSTVLRIREEIDAFVPALRPPGFFAGVDAFENALRYLAAELIDPAGIPALPAVGILGEICLAAVRIASRVEISVAVPGVGEAFEMSALSARTPIISIRGEALAGRGRRAFRVARPAVDVVALDVDARVQVGVRTAGAIRLPVRAPALLVDAGHSVRASMSARAAILGIVGDGGLTAVVEEAVAVLIDEHGARSRALGALRDTFTVHAP
jgi:hypothetical protein